MVLLHIKAKDESLFLYETALNASVDAARENVVRLYNCYLKIQRICSEMERLSLYGPSKPLEQCETLEDKCSELKICEERERKYEAKGGTIENKDPAEARIGRMPSEEGREVLAKVIAEVRGLISSEQVKSGVCLTQAHIQEAIDILRGGVLVVYPMNLPVHDPVRCELENREDLSGSEEQKRVIAVPDAQLWFAGKELQNDKKLHVYFGKNEKSKVVVKLQRKGQGIPLREPVISEDEKKELVLAEFRRREELKKLEEDEDNSYLDSDWADNFHLKKSFHGLQNVTWKPH